MPGAIELDQVAQPLRSRSKLALPSPEEVRFRLCFSNPRDVRRRRRKRAWPAAGNRAVVARSVINDKWSRSDDRNVITINWLRQLRRRKQPPRNAREALRAAHPERITESLTPATCSDRHLPTLTFFPVDPGEQRAPAPHAVAAPTL